jgi:tetratricopeptide (TPR) repeat protein
MTILLSLLLASVIFSQDNREYSQWWLATYGDYVLTGGQKDSRVRESFKVFERVRNTVEKGTKRTPRLFIISSGGDPFAVSLPDGGIIISKKTLDTCYSKVKPETGNRRMAFIIGHELAHLANDDFMHREVFRIIKKYGKENANEEAGRYFNLTGPEKAKESRLKEIMADRKGVLYASMAGYDVGSLFGSSDDFLSYWVEQTGIKNSYDRDTNYPSMENRLKFIRTQLEDIIHSVESFRAGVLLYQCERFHDALAAFSEFSKTYPAREVFNNMGACHLSLALKRMSVLDKDIFYRFRLATAIDFTTTARDVSQPLRSGSDLLEDFSFSFRVNEAKRCFETAVRKDPTNGTSHCNLAAMYILKKEYARAMAECDDVLKTDSKNIDALNNKAIAFYLFGEQTETDTFQRAYQYLEEAFSLHPNNHIILYNLASMAGKRLQTAGAKQYWEKYLAVSPHDDFFKQAHKKLKKEGQGVKKKANAPPGLSQFSTIKLGSNFSKVEKRFGKENTIFYKTGSQRKNKTAGKEDSFSLIDIQVGVKGNLRVLAQNGIVEIIELMHDTGKDANEMATHLGAPDHIVRHTTGNFYVYRNPGFSFKEINGKVHSFIWFEARVN